MGSDYINKYTAAFLLRTDLKGFEKYVKHGAVTKAKMGNRNLYSLTEIQELIADREKKLAEKELSKKIGGSSNA